jgi:transglutaminase-like putative cysteine protease
MDWKPPEGMEEYLKATEICDCDNAGLKKRAKEIIKDSQTPREAALRIFSFVRDGVIWKVDAIDLKASKTLKKRGGVCQNKANLHIALLRAVGIPARYHQVSVKKEGWKFMSGLVYKLTVDPIWYHTWCECYLGKNWVACESVFDEALYKGMLQQGLATEEQIPTIDWNGESDLIVVNPWIVEDVGSFSSLDAVFKKAQKEASRPRIISWLVSWLVLYLSNQHTDSIRKKGKPSKAA